MDPITAYYLQQGRGTDDGEFRASYTRQRGRGVWSGFFSNLWRTARPYVAKAAKAVGKQALTTGGDILKDLAEKPVDRDVSDIAKQRVAEAQRALSAKMDATMNKMRGKGVKRGRSSSAQAGRGTKKKAKTESRGKQRRGETTVARGRGSKNQLGGGIRKKQKKVKTTVKQKGKGIKRSVCKSKQQSRAKPQRRIAKQYQDVFGKFRR